MIARTGVAVGGLGVEVDCVSGFDMVGHVSVLDVEASREQDKKLAADVLVSTRLAAFLHRQKLSKVRI